jgi:hypothetical protein
MLPATTERVPEHTTVAVNRRIAEDTAERVRHFAHHPEQIAERLRELDEEWDIERAIEANAATLSLAGVALSVTSDRRWLALPALVSAFLLQHATQGWCPPVPVLRRLGFRTAREIDTERAALKALRGDFGDLDRDDPEAMAIRAVAAARL